MRDRIMFIFAVQNRKFNQRIRISNFFLILKYLYEITDARKKKEITLPNDPKTKTITKLIDFPICHYREVRK